MKTRAVKTKAPDSSDEIERLAWLLDRSIPIGPWRIGIDPLIGLIPGFGDLAGGAISAYIILQAHRAGLPKATMLRMVANVAIDSALGSIPFVGDAFDFAWQANVRNVRLYKEALTGQRTARRDTAFLVLLLLLLAVLVALPIVLLIALGRALF